MRRWIALAANLYPQPWRGRYGEEFDALLEDVSPGWREFSDVLRGALKMQMTNATTYWKLAGALAVAGAVAATAVSFSIPGRYESTAVMRMAIHRNPQSAAPVGKDARENLSRQLNEIEQSVLSRTSLEGLITQPGLDLYKEERARMPMEDIVQQMRQRDLRISLVHPPPGASDTDVAFAISFSYPDQQKAQAVVRELVTKFTGHNALTQRMTSRFWTEIWPQSAPAYGQNLEVLDPPSFPKESVSPHRLSYAALGLFSGLMLGLLAAIATRRPKWTLQIAGLAVVCGAVAFAVSLLLPEAYTSTCVMRMTRAMVPESSNGDMAITPPTVRLERLETQALSDASLEEIVTNPTFELYQRQRASKPMKEIVETMRTRDLNIRMLNPLQGPPESAEAFAVSFTYPDKFKAQAVVRQVVTNFTEDNVNNNWERAQASGNPKIVQIEERKMGENLEVMDPPSDPQEPVSPNRLEISLAGFLLGLLLGASTIGLLACRTAGVALTSGLVVLTVGIIMNAAPIRAQSPPKFEVASVKPTPGASNSPPDSVELNVLTAIARNSKNGRFNMRSSPLSLLIQFAYNVESFQVLGGPSWINSDRYDVIAKADGNATFAQMRPMLQSLLADRFQLALRRETREFPIYELAVAKGGLKFAAAKEGSCVTRDPNNPPPPLNPNRPLNICGGVNMRILGAAPDRRERFDAVGISMPKLIEILILKTAVECQLLRGTVARALVRAAFTLV